MLDRRVVKAYDGDFLKSDKRLPLDRVDDDRDGDGDVGIVSRVCRSPGVDGPAALPGRS